MNKAIYNVAVIGCGLLARAKHIPNINRCPQTRLHTCCDIQESTLAALLKQYPGIRTTTKFEEAIADPEVDVIVIATTEHFRVPLVEAAAKAGKPVLMEKPLASTLEDALKIQDIVTESGIAFCVAHNRRCSPAMVQAHKIFRNHMERENACPWRYRREGWEQTAKIVQKEGHLAALSIRINDDWWSWKPVHLQGINAEVGLLLSEMTHFADVACWFLKAEPDVICAQGSGVLNHAVSIKFKTGEIASIVMGSNGTFGYPKELMEVTGNGGILVVDHMLEVRTAGIEGAPRRKVFPMLDDRHPDVGEEGGVSGWIRKKQAACEEASEYRDASRQFTAEPDKGHAHILRAFLQEIRGEREPVSPIQPAITAMKICLAAIRSIREQRFVALSEIE
jgi:predicted dehydrogenase